MKIELFTALTGVNISEEKAEQVVAALTAFIDMQISQATQPLLQRLDALQGNLSSQMKSDVQVLTSQIQAIATVKTETEAERKRRSELFRWVIGTGITVCTATLGILKALGKI